MFVTGCAWPHHLGTLRGVFVKLFWATGIPRVRLSADHEWHIRGGGWCRHPRSPKPQSNEAQKPPAF